MPSPKDVDIKDILSDTAYQGIILKQEKYWGLWVEQDENDVWISHRKHPKGLTQEVDFLSFFGTYTSGDIFRLVNDGDPILDSENMETLVWYNGIKFKCGRPN